MNRLHPQILVAILVALGLLVAGMRVPDLSRPHRPKPIHRVIVESQYKTAVNHAKQHNHSDCIAVLPIPQVAGTTVSYRAVSQPVPPLYASPQLSPDSGRSPPAALG